MKQPNSVGNAMARWLISALLCAMFAAQSMAQATSSPSGAQASTTVSFNISVLKEAVQALGAAADSIQKWNDAIAHMVRTGSAGYNYATAERDYNRLKDISARATTLAATKQVRVVNGIDHYLSMKNPTFADWEEVTQQMREVLVDVKGLLDDVKKERSDFVLEKSYAILSGTLAARASLLDRLTAMSPPVTSEEMKQLNNVNTEYKRLLGNFQTAIEQLNEYLKGKKRK